MKITINNTPFKFTLIFSAMLFFSLVSAAQVKPVLWTIAGKIIDSATKQPVGYATVRLKTIKNVPVKEVLANADGAFTFSAIHPSKYVISFDASGYQNKTIAITDTTQTVINLPPIYMSVRINGLKEVAITADRPIIKQEVDRISYDLQADPDSKGSNVLQMLRKVPFVSLDGDDNILLKGNTSYKILINGKPSSMVERDPKNILRSMPASTIQRIEVITIPPAKYDAEGIGGIINIITNKKIDNGYNGSVNVNSRYPGGPGVGTSFTIKTGKFGVSGFSGGSIYNNPTTTSLNTRITTGTAPTNLTQQGTGSSDGKSGYFGTELSYEIDSLQLISAQFNINGNNSNGNNSQTSLLTGQAGILQGYNLANLSNGSGNGIDASVNYQLGFKKNKAKLLTFSYRYFNYHNASANNLATSNQINYTTPDYTQEDNTFASEQTAQVDYVQGFKKWSVEAGAKAIFRDNRSDFQYNSFNAAIAQFEPDAALSNKYNSTQNILAAYNTWQYGGKNWGVKAGVRIEETTTDADFITTTSIVHQNYFDVIPSVAINFDLKNNSGFNFGFTQRIKRPGINKLNPYVDRSNPNFISTGNPALQRVLINDIQLTYHTAKKASLTISAIYDFGNNLDLQVSTFDPATNITYTTTKNVGKVAGAGGFVNFNYPITKQLNFSANTHAMYFWLNGPVGGVEQSNNFLALSLSSSVGYTFTNGWRLSGNVYANGRNPTGLQGSSNGFTGTGLSVNKQLIKNKLSFNASVNNPVTKYRNNVVTTTGPDFTQTQLNQTYFRSFSASLNYNFGKLKGGIKKNKRGINNDD